LVKRCHEGVRIAARNPRQANIHCLRRANYLQIY
jgi:hypothetical protein